MTDFEFESFQVTKTVFRTGDFLSWQRHKHLELRPPFQRGIVWTAKARSYFIDSIIRGYPVPVIFMQDKTDEKTHEPVRQVVDGQQRLRTVLAYVDPSCLPDLTQDERFTIQKTHNSELAGLRFADLPREAKNRILHFEFSVHILPSYTPRSVLLELFARMNSSGVKVNEQELRNAKFFGECKQLCYELAYYNTERWIGWGVFNSGQIARMKEVELVSELLMSMIYGLDRKSQKTIDAFYKRYDDEFTLAQRLSSHMETVLDLLDRIAAPKNEPNRSAAPLLPPFNNQGWFYVLFVALHELLYGTQTIDGARAKHRRPSVSNIRTILKERAEKVRADQASGRIDPKLLQSLRGAATDRISRETRHKFLLRGGLLET